MADNSEIKSFDKEDLPSDVNTEQNNYEKDSNFEENFDTSGLPTDEDNK